MFAKLTMVIVGLTGMAACLMSLRQEKMEISHDIALAHRQINQERQALWRLQGQVAHRLEPQALNRSIAVAKLDLEPITPVAPIQAEPARPLRGPRVVDRSPTSRQMGE